MSIVVAAAAAAFFGIVLFSSKFVFEYVCSSRFIISLEQRQEENETLLYEIQLPKLQAMSKLCV